MKRITLLLLLSFVGYFSYAQHFGSIRQSYRGRFQPYKFKLEYQSGGIIVHTEDEQGTGWNKVGDLVKNNLNGLELSIEFPTIGRENWQFYYNLPTIGIGLNYIDLGNPEMLGQSIALYPYLNIPFVKNRYFELNLRPGWGISYITKKFVNVPTWLPNSGISKYSVMNFAVGSNLNSYITLGVNAEIKPFKTSVYDRWQDFFSRFSFSIGGAYYHISNGSIEQPNAGLNLAVASVGIKYNPYFTTPPQMQTVENLPRKFSLDFTVRGGVREMHRFDTEKSPVGSLGVVLYKQLNNIYRLGAGLNGFYDQAYTIHTVFNDPPNGKYKDVDYTNPGNRYRLGLCLSNELIINRLSVGFDAGIYLIDPIQADGWNYFSVSMKYHITDNIYASIGLKSHMFDAEFMDFGVGYSLPVSFARPKPKPYSKATHRKSE